MLVNYFAPVTSQYSKGGTVPGWAVRLQLLQLLQEPLPDSGVQWTGEVLEEAHLQNEGSRNDMRECWEKQK